MMNPIRRRTLTGAGLLTVVALTLAACGPDTSGGSANADDGEDAIDFSDIEPADSITFWSNHPGGSIDIERELIERFEAETGISVELVTAGANYEEVSQRFQTAQASGDVGDVIVLSDATWFPNYLNGSLLPLDSALEAAEIDTAGYHAALFEDYLYEGSHYGAPYARSTPLFYYNKDHYEAAGLEDRAPETWEEVVEFSEALEAAGVSSAAFAFPPQDQYPGWTMANLVWGYGGAWSNEWDFDVLTSEETIEALTFAQEATGDWASVTSGDPADEFSAGAVSQVVASTGGLAGTLDAASFEVGVGFLPGGPAEQGSIVPTGGAGLSIASASTPERQLAAAMFVGFVTNAESAAFFSAGTGYLPVHTGADMADVYAQTPQFEVAVNQLERARVQDFARVFLPGGDLALSRTLQNILTTDADVATELEALRAEFESLYERDLADVLG